MLSHPFGNLESRDEVGTTEKVNVGFWCDTVICFCAFQAKKNLVWFISVGFMVKEGPVTMSLPPALSALLLPLAESDPQSDTHNFLNLTHTTFSI